MKLAVVGSRDLILIPEKSIEIIYNYVNKYNIAALVSGGAKGADTYAEIVAKKLGIPVKIFHAEWEKYGKAAGYIRNEQIVEYADGVVAFYYGNKPSKGAKHSINIAISTGKPIKEIFITLDK